MTIASDTLSSRRECKEGRLSLKGFYSDCAVGAQFTDSVRVVA